LACPEGAVAAVPVGDNDYVECLKVAISGLNLTAQFRSGAAKKADILKVKLAACAVVKEDGTRYHILR